MTEYKLAKLAKLAGVTERTIRYYSSQGLLPAPLGGGKNTHYDDEHLASLEQIKTLQAAGYSLDQIRQKTRPDPEPTTEILEAFHVSPDMMVIFRPSMPLSQRQHWIRKLTEIAEKDEQDGN